MGILERINTPADLRQLELETLSDLADELRQFLLSGVSRTGGHLASSLGAVELTIALHYAFDTPKDQLVWDVGHQCYPHKVLTGRRDRFHTLRTYGGISGFLKREESEYDVFNAGHASTSISAALGIAAGRDLKGESFRVAAIIGDGSFTGGQAMEGLNQAGYLGKRLMIILNDNEMSISPNVGAMQGYLNRVIHGQPYRRLKDEVEQFLRSIPRVGEGMVKWAKQAEQMAKQLLVPGNLFEELGFKYVGPINGHSIPQLVQTFREYRDYAHPVLVHVVTRKGQGWKPAEQDPVFWHGANPFSVTTGEVKRSPGPPSYTRVFAETLTELAKQDPRIVAITAAMVEGTGLDIFARAHKERLFDVGICEEHAVTFAGGLATRGLRPVVAVYSSFAQRAFDQVFHDVCLMRLPVVLALDRGGLVGADGPTHHGVFDLSFLRCLPELVIMAPKDEDELRHMLATALACERPVALRYPRGSGYGVAMDGPPRLLPIGKAEILRSGRDGVIWAIGIMATEALRAAERLAAEAGPDLGVVNARFVKPLDTELLSAHLRPGARIMTVEENALDGGFGSAVMEAANRLGARDVAFERLGVPDEYQPHGSQEILRARLDLDVEGICRRARAFFPLARVGPRPVARRDSA
ncbi:MAG TPA: 1-deoxy-D-xylulose-5-phosphate synthase [Thermoanaerobaculaceae bacterium]|nr:1-deoxy-D-xylulose-5-phosphate synthase [Thermoanaerobaculaceae bacterium]HRS16550.1 1-deoxy-D-xylulose-5-phosphate synthase [Thermoanaerobaculaceae bacterium]